MPNYQDGKIYKIVCNITDECYIGSTCEPTLARRLATHVSNYKKWKACKSNKTTSFDIIDRGDYQIYLIDSYPCNSRDELTAREGEIIRQFKHDCGCTNIKIEGRTKKVYYQDNKELIKISEKVYREKNKEAIKERKKEYYEENKDKIQEYFKKYYENNKDKKKQYLENNKDKIKQYLEDNKEKINEKKKEIITCICGSCFRKADKSRHEKTHKHQSYIKSIE
jgi:hypothetical protein